MVERINTSCPITEELEAKIEELHNILWEKAEEVQRLEKQLEAQRIKNMAKFWEE